jgi:hypothetical protein
MIPWPLPYLTTSYSTEKALEHFGIVPRLEGLVESSYLFFYLLFKTQHIQSFGGKKKADY